MPFCTKCGTQNDTDAGFCNNCGQKLEALDTKQPSPQQKPEKSSNTFIIVISIFLVLAIAGTIYHIKGTGVKIGKSDSKEPVAKTDTTKTEKENKGTVIPDFQQSASKVADKVFGSDQEVDALEKKPSPPKFGASDVEKAADYNYPREDCDTLYTDVFQQVGYSIEQELLKVTKMSEQDENEIGKQVAKQIEKQFKGKLDKDKAWLNYVRELGKNIVTQVKRRGIDYHFHVINDDMVNAFAIPGGGIYIFTGILNKIDNEAQLAGIIAHEVKHVDLRHCIALYQFLSKLPEAAQNPISFKMAQTVKHPYSARQEADADRRGLELIYSFGYSPYQVVQFWEHDIDGGKSTPQKRNNEGLFGVLGRIGDEVGNVLSTHPKHEKRACLLKSHVLKLQEQYPLDTVYVGAWNYSNKVPMFKTQK